MGGMPLLETANWLHQVNGLYLTIIPCFFWINNFLGPKVMEPVFCRDFLIAQFEKMAEPVPGAVASSTSAVKSVVVESSKPSTAAFVPTPGKAPQLPKNMFARSAIPGTRGRLLKLASVGVSTLFK